MKTHNKMTNIKSIIKILNKMLFKKEKEDMLVKKRGKVLAMLLSVCLAGGMLAGCGNGGDNTESTSSAGSTGDTSAADSSSTTTSSGTSSTSASSGTTAEMDGEGIKIAFVISDLSNEVFIELMDACEAEATARGAEFTFQEAQEVSDKITAIENLSNAGYDVIISHVSDPDAMQPAIEQAQANGSKFIAYDTDTETSDAFFGADNTELGKQIGYMAGDWINETFDSSETVKVGVCSYPPFNFLVVREQGIIDGLAEVAPNAEIVVSQQAGFVPEGVDVGEVWLQSNPDLNCIVGINDSGVVGVYQSFVAGGIDPKDEKIGMFGCDASGEAMRLIGEDGIFRGSISTNLVKTAPQFIDKAIKLANGEEVEHDYFFPMTRMQYNSETGQVEAMGEDVDPNK